MKSLVINLSILLVNLSLVIICIQSNLSNEKPLFDAEYPNLEMSQISSGNNPNTSQYENSDCQKTLSKINDLLQIQIAQQVEYKKQIESKIETLILRQNDLDYAINGKQESLLEYKKNRPLTVLDYEQQMIDEPFDQTLTSETENEVNTAIQQLELNNLQVNLMNISCTSTLCKLELSAATEDEAIQALTLTSDSLSWTDKHYTEYTIDKNGNVNSMTYLLNKFN